MITKQQNVISRRRFLACGGVIVAAAMVAPRYLFAGDNLVQIRGAVDPWREQAARADIAVQSLRGNVRVLSGSGGNIAVLPGRDGKFLVDAGMVGSRAKIADALTGISAEPVKHLVNTHWHFDHTDGNEWLHSAGATILAHENTRKHLSSSTRVEAWDFTFPPQSAGGIPTAVVDDAKILRLNATTVSVEHHGPAHTDGDVTVHFTDADILHTGDVWWNGNYPFIDYSTGGSIDGMIRVANACLAEITDKTILIPGHGPVGDKARLTAYRDLLVAVRDKVASLKKQGRSFDEVVAAKPTAAFDAKWGGGFVSPANFTGLVYQGL